MLSAGYMCTDKTFLLSKGKKSAAIMMELVGATVCPDLCTPGLVDGYASTRICSIVSKKTTIILGNPTNCGFVLGMFCVLNFIQKLMRDLCNCHKTTLFLIT